MKFNIENLKEIGRLTKELAAGLRKLTLPNNFQGFEVNVTIPATSEQSVRNSLNFVPTRYIILSQTGNGLITKSSTTAWNLNKLYFYNHGSATVDAKIFIMG